MSIGVFTSNCKFSFEIFYSENKSKALVSEYQNKYYICLRKTFKIKTICVICFLWLVITIL